MGLTASPERDDFLTFHELKCWPEYFAHVKAGVKNFEVRLNDRDYQPGHVLILREWDPRAGYSGDMIIRRVTYVLPGGQFGIEDTYCVLGLGVPA